MSDIQPSMSSVSCEGSTAGTVNLTPLPAPHYYHVLYQGSGETQVSWHGETYCLVGGYRLYGDAPLATPAKAEEENTTPTNVAKKHKLLAEPDEDSGCSSTKIPSSVEITTNYFQFTLNTKPLRGPQCEIELKELGSGN